MTVLVFHIGSLGDTIVTIPVLRAIRAIWPGARVVMLHNAPARPGLLAPFDVLESTGLVDAYVPYRRDASGPALWRELARTWRVIRRLDADVAVFAGPSDRGPAALRRDRLFLASAGIGQLVGFEPAGARSGSAPARGTSHESQLKLARIGERGRPASAAAVRMPLLVPGEADKARVAEWCRTLGEEPGRLVAVGTGSLMPAKSWPLERFVALGERLRREGLSPVVVGGPEERADGDQLVERWGGGLNAAGIFAVRESAALLSLCRAFVGIDSGSAHLAAAVGTRAVVLTSGRAPRGQWDPLGPGHIVLRHATPCEECRHVSCPLADHPCMRGLTIDEAWRALEPIVKQDRP